MPRKHCPQLVKLGMMAYLTTPIIICPNSPQSDKFIEFGRAPVWNCPMPEPEEEHPQQQVAEKKPATSQVAVGNGGEYSVSVAETLPCPPLMTGSIVVSHKCSGDYSMSTRRAELNYLLEKKNLVV